MLAQQQEVKKQERENEQLKAGLAGKVEEEAKEEEEPEGTPEEITKGYRWVALTGVLDHKQLRENYAKALKIDFASAAPHYLGLEAERQTMNSDGTWPENWDMVDRVPSEKILDDAAEIEEELVPKESILEPLVDDLPFLRANFYRGVHIAELVPKEKRQKEVSKLGTGNSGGFGAGGKFGGMSSGGSSAGGLGGMSGAGAGYGDMMGGAVDAPWTESDRAGEVAAVA